MEPLFTELLESYLNIKDTSPEDYPGYVDGYTNKGYYEDFRKIEETLNNYVAGKR